MKELNAILRDIDKLPLDDLELILKRIVHRLHESQRIESIIEEYRGIGKGIWDSDAQEFINKLRENERL